MDFGRSGNLVLTARQLLRRPVLCLTRFLGTGIPESLLDTIEDSSGLRAASAKKPCHRKLLFLSLNPERSQSF